MARTFRSGLNNRGSSIPRIVPMMALVISLCRIWCLAEPLSREDTLELPPNLVTRDTAANAESAKTILLVTDEDRLLGSLGDLLERVGGLHVVRAGGIGDYLGVSVRGESEHQVNVYVNGVLQNQANDPSLFLNGLDLSRLEKIEVYKGLAPADLPGAPMGGAINIITRETVQGASAQGALGLGSFGSAKGNGSIDIHRDGWQSHAQLTHDQSKGDFTYYDDNGTEFQKGRNPNGIQRLGAGDLVQKVRQNNAHTLTGMDASFSLAPAPTMDVGAQADATWLHKQVPAPYANLDSAISISTFDESVKYSCHGYGHWTKPEHSIALDLSGTLLTDTYVDTANGLGAVGTGYNNDRNEYADLLATLSGKQIIVGEFSLSGLISYGLSSYLYSDRTIDKTYPRLYRYTGEGKVAPSYVIGHHALQAVFSETIDLQEYNGDETYAYGGVRLANEEWSRHWALQGGYQFKPLKRFWIFAQLGSAYRIPTFQEKFGDRGTLLGNPSLQPEQGAKASLGLHAESAKTVLDAQMYASEGHRIITLVQNSQSVLFYSNTGATRIFGGEASLSETPVSWSRTELGLTLQKALSLSDGSAQDAYKLIPYRPLTQASLRQVFTHAGWTFNFIGYYQGLAYPNASNSPSLFDSYSHNTEWQSRIDLSLSWRRKKILAVAGINNVFDQRNFDFFNFPLPGRNFSVALQSDL